MIVLCSAGTLVRNGALREIEEQIDEDADKIVPISLDKIWKDPGFAVKRGDRDLKPFLLQRNYIDFNTKRSRLYEKSLQRLLGALKHQEVS